MADVSITGPADIHGSFVSQGITFYGWTFPVVVNGQAGVYTVWVDTNNPADEAGIANDAVQDLQNDPGQLEPISDNDPGTGPGDFGDPGDQGDFGDDDGGDGVLAGNDGGAGGDSV
jgi:hypothetical protein